MYHGNVEVRVSAFVTQEPEGKVELVVGDTYILLDKKGKYQFGRIMELYDTHVIMQESDVQGAFTVYYVDIVRVVQRKEQTYERVSAQEG